MNEKIAMDTFTKSTTPLNLTGLLLNRTLKNMVKLILFMIFLYQPDTDKIQNDVRDRAYFCAQSTYIDIPGAYFTFFFTPIGRIMMSSTGITPLSMEFIGKSHVYVENFADYYYLTIRLLRLNRKETVSNRIATLGIIISAL